LFIVHLKSDAVITHYSVYKKIIAMFRDPRGAEICMLPSLKDSRLVFKVNHRPD